MKDPIEELFDRLEEYVFFVMVSRPPFTKGTMIDKVLLAIQLTGAFKLVTWSGLDLMRQPRISMGLKSFHGYI